eukprot:4726518-Alexandrium_andersonii.AAC.1
MASGLGPPSGSSAPKKQTGHDWRGGPADWNADISDGEESSYAVRVPGDDAASEASAQASKASPNAQPPEKQAKTEA